MNRFKVFLIKRIKLFLKLVGLFQQRNKWPEISERKKQYLIKNVKIKSSVETLNDIRYAINNKQKGAYMRFGDGDIYLMLGKDEMLNVANEKLSKEMKEAMNCNIGTNHIGLPIHSKLFGYEVGMTANMHLVSDSDAIKYLATSYKYIDIKNIYTPVALHYLATFNRDFCVEFLRFLKKTNPIFVGNKNIKTKIIHQLFGDIYIKTPISDSFQEIDRIEQELIAFLKETKNEFRVVVLAMGCPGRVLQKRILKRGYNVYLFDFGSLLDAFNNDNTRLWIDLAGGTESLQEILEQID